MKILHLSLHEQPALRRMLQGMGEYHGFDWFPQWERGEIPGLQRRILELNEKVRPDFVFMHLQTPGIVTPDIAQRLHGFVLNWCGDVREPLPKWYRELAPHIDLTCFTNMEDVEAILAAGQAAAFLQIGYDDVIYRPDGPSRRRAWPEIVFLGADYAGRFPMSAERLEMVKLLRNRYGKRFEAYGRGFEPMLDSALEAECYRSCKIAIHQSQFLRRRYFSDRLLRILGCGAFCLAREYPGIDADWEYKTNGVCFRKWSSLEELTAEIDTMLELPLERAVIANQGHRETLIHHSWQARRADLEAILKNAKVTL